SAAGGAEEPLISNPAVDIEPAWSRDGKSLYFVSARDGGFKIFRHDFDGGKDTGITNGNEPAISPDGKQMAFEQRGLSVLDLASGQAKGGRAGETGDRGEAGWAP